MHGNHHFKLIKKRGVLNLYNFLSSVPVGALKGNCKLTINIFI